MLLFKFMVFVTIVNYAIGWFGLVILLRASRMRFEGDRERFVDKVNSLYDCFVVNRLVSVPLLVGGFLGLYCYAQLEEVKEKVRCR